MPYHRCNDHSEQQTYNVRPHGKREILRDDQHQAKHERDNEHD